MAKPIPTARARRTAVVGRFAAQTAIKGAGTRAANTVRGRDAKRRAVERRHVEAAEALVVALGTMKGAAMKVGQMLSVIHAWGQCDGARPRHRVTQGRDHGAHHRGARLRARGGQPAHRREDNPEELHRLGTEGGFLNHPDRVSPQEAFAYTNEAWWWWTTDQEIELTPEISNEAVMQTVNPMSEHIAKALHQQMPAEHLFARRMETMVLAALGQLHATANWHRIACEWLYGDTPVTELGRQEADWIGAVA